MKNSSYTEVVEDVVIYVRLLSALANSLLSRVANFLLHSLISLPNKPNFSSSYIYFKTVVSYIISHRFFCISYDTVLVQFTSVERIRILGPICPNKLFERFQFLPKAAASRYFFFSGYYRFLCLREAFGAKATALSSILN